MSEEDKKSKELVHSSRFWDVSDDSLTSKDLTEQEISWHRSTEAVRISTYGAIALEEIKCKQTESNPVEEGDKNLNPSFSATKDLKKDKCYDALVYFNGEHSSFEDSSGSGTSATPRDPSLICEEVPGDSGEIPTVDVLYNIIIEDKDVVELMDKMWTSHYTASRFPENEIYSKCKGLFEKDYICEVVDNFGGNLSDHYPIRVIIPVSRKRTEECEGFIEFDKEKYSKQVKNSISSRCRTRFVAPVILCDNKFICRAGTLSVRKGAVYESATKNEPPQDQYINGNIFQTFGYLLRNATSSVVHIFRSAAEAIMNLIDISSMERMREIDVQVLKELKVQRICDLMIEDRKMFKQVIRVSSSEKIHRDTYQDFNIEQMPYPGCKFFRRYHKTGRRAEGLIFNWNRADVNTDLLLTEDPYTGFPDIDWESYKTWDVIELTKNYMKILLSYIIKGNGGILVHCISGWDRTPLMISLLRVSLWADGVIHETLGILEMAYLTLAYDWYLFGHNLPARLQHEEEIMHFCFKFLSHIASDEFSSTRIFQELSPELKNRNFPEFKPKRRFNFLHKLSCLVLDTYKAQITRRTR